MPGIPGGGPEPAVAARRDGTGSCTGNVCSAGSRFCAPVSFNKPYALKHKLQDELRVGALIQIFGFFKSPNMIGAVYPGDCKPSALPICQCWLEMSHCRPAPRRNLSCYDVVEGISSCVERAAFDKLFETTFEHRPACGSVGPSIFGEGSCDTS